MRGKTLRAYSQVSLRNAGRELLVITEEEEIWVNIANTREVVTSISEKDVNIGEESHDSLESFLLRLFRESAFHFLYSDIARHHDECLASSTCFVDHILMPWVETIERPKEENTHKGR